MKKAIIYILIGVVGLGLGFLSSNYWKDDISIGSIATGQDYYATSTPSDSAQVDGQIVKGAGSLGSVIVTSAVGNMELSILDATTTNAVIRPAGEKATSTIEIARIKTDTPGTFVFDVSFRRGLYLDVISGTLGTTTITYR